ncbi:M15 family metallopeptidase [Paenibacillus methanolicus]|uniref:D-alanyl-D-alanine carboxypeptidase n=1 Tax=Paenibacillus methanolicus TaxID=582686 RepID=A0A5S5BPV5_9BACL|nr:M15 family metallopeptidase [Paenibacillus methanolicus]TYP68376.1 D-alanyl-D-alanine carboxypeptidase [Paenibacillus methanolicus]
MTTATRKRTNRLAALLLGAGLLAGCTVSGIADATAHAAAASTFLHDNAAVRTVTKNAAGKSIVTNSQSTVVLVNKQRNLPSTYVPTDLVVPNVSFSFAGSSPKKQMRSIAAGALEKLFAAAKKDGIRLAAVSGYRSYATQKAIFDRNKSIKGAAVANKTSALPGQSEHQTGLAMDISSASAGYALEASFGDTKEGKWLAKHAADYGFIIRYGKGMEKLTGYSYEPWHVRYVGVYIAKEIMSKHLTLEQYLARYN